MSGVVDLFSGNSFAQSFAKTATLVARPTMDLQISQLQDAVITRLNTKITEASGQIDDNNRALSRHLNTTQSKLNGVLSNYEKYLFDNGRNMMTVEGLSEKLTSLNDALTANDTTSFNQHLTDINWMVGMLNNSQGHKIGISVDDGVSNLQAQGLVTYDNAGTPTQATSRADFADDAEASAAITTAINMAIDLLTTMTTNQEAGEGLRSATEGKINSTLLQIQITQLATETEKADEVEKLRQHYAQLLQAFSLAFDSSVALTEKMSGSLFEPAKLQPGSVMNLFS